ncbi:MAG: DmsC/YnfH family molybdoenzyme membrane anchor subunit [Burkholderiales bacterium]|nr:DmsC/YnfH family molybdoenzyme membrane anchor subunit [Burkholderiales bacterium]
MNSAWPVVLSTTLAGTGQGLVVALVAAELARPAPAAFQLAGSALALAFLAAGLAASLFCLGRPERASRAAARSRASWRSREAIVRPIFAAAVALWASAHALGFARAETLAIGAAALALDATLFLCTGMNCAGLAFVRERASYLAPLNFALLGTASGFSLSVPLAVLAHPPFAGPLALAAFWLAALAWLARGAAVLRERPAASRSERRVGDRGRASDAGPNLAGHHRRVLQYPRVLRPRARACACRRARDVLPALFSFARLAPWLGRGNAWRIRRGVSRPVRGAHRRALAVLRRGGSPAEPLIGRRPERAAAIVGWRARAARDEKCASGKGGSRVFPWTAPSAASE